MTAFELAYLVTGLVIADLVFPSWPFLAKMFAAAFWPGTLIVE